MPVNNLLEPFDFSNCILNFDTPAFNKSFLLLELFCDVFSSSNVRTEVNFKSQYSFGACLESSGLSGLKLTDYY